jgi:hypothetical protein
MKRPGNSEPPRNAANGDCPNREVLICVLPYNLTAPEVCNEKGMKGDMAWWNDYALSFGASWSLRGRKRVRRNGEQGPPRSVLTIKAPLGHAKLFYDEFRVHLAKKVGCFRHLPQSSRVYISEVVGDESRLLGKEICQTDEVNENTTQAIQDALFSSADEGSEAEEEFLAGDSISRAQRLSAAPTGRDLRLGTRLPAPSLDTKLHGSSDVGSMSERSLQVKLAHRALELLQVCYSTSAWKASACRRLRRQVQHVFSLKACEAHSYLPS